MKVLIILLILFSFSVMATPSLRAQSRLKLKWAKTYGGGLSDYMQTMRQTSDGGYIMAGSSISGIDGKNTGVNKGGSDYWIVKVDSNGNEEWNKSYGGNDSDIPFSIEQTREGKYILGGYSVSDRSGDKSEPIIGKSDFWVLLLNPDGSKIWDRTFGLGLYSELTTVQQTLDGGFVLGGWAQIKNDSIVDSIMSPCHFWIIKLNQSGSKVWDKTYGGPEGEQLFTLLQTPEGGFLLAGISGSDVGGDKTAPKIGGGDIWLVKIDQNGEKVWDKTYGGRRNDFLNSLSHTSDGGFILGGHTMSGKSGGKLHDSPGVHDYWIVKLDSNGKQIWDKSFPMDITAYSNVIQTKEGGYAVSFYRNKNTLRQFSQENEIVNSSTKSQCGVIKLNSRGKVKWKKTIDSIQIEAITSLVQIPDGSFILGGFTNSDSLIDKSLNKGGADYLLIKLGSK